MAETWVVEFKVGWLEKLKPPEVGRVNWRDAKQTGLVLRVHCSGSMTWYANYRVKDDPKPKWVRLGPWPQVSLADARERVAGITANARGGEDEADTRRREREAPTLQAIADAYLERHARKKMESWPLVEHRIRKHLAELGKRKAKLVRKADVVELLEAIAEKTPVEANRTLTLIRRIYTWASAVDLVDTNPCSGIERPGMERTRRRRLSDAEIRDVWHACAKLRGAGKDAARLVLLTAQRGGEVLSMEWRDLDLDAALWTIPAAKTKAGKSHDRDDHEVPLPPAALAILLARHAKASSPWVFPGRDDSGPVKKLRRTVQSLRKLAAPGEPTPAGKRKAKTAPPPAELEDFRGHDLRRTAASGLGDLGVEPHVISRLLNHAQGGVTGIYNRAKYRAEKRDALERWAARVMEIVGG